ncbi:uncharacterized protein WCC33_000963 [Rhinophrynus dorsalis]
MGCSVSCAFFEVFSSFLHWEVELRPGSVAHYLDDFMFVGPRDSEECGESLELALARFKVLGVPVAGDKTVRPTTRLTFLGIEIDSMGKLVRLPLEKVQLARDQVRRALGASKLQLRMLQSLLGTLNFATRVIPMGRVFSRRLGQATVGVKQPFHWVRVTKQLKEDLKVWEAFLEDFNGVRLWRSAPESSAELQLETDASGSVGFGACCGRDWCTGVWPASWKEKGLTRNLTLLELFPIVVALELWQGQFANRGIVFWTDNMSVVHAITNLTSHSQPVLSLLRYLVLLCMRRNIQFRAKHVPGVENGGGRCLI